MLKWLLIAGLALVLIAALLAAIGYLLPQGHVASRSAYYRAPPDAVFAVISDVAAGAAWRPDLQKVEMLPAVEGRERFREIGRTGAITMEVIERTPPARQVVRIADPDQPFGGTWTYELAPDDGGTRVTITERGEIYNPIFRALARFVFGYTSTMEDYLRALGARLGESVTPVGQD